MRTLLPVILVLLLTACGGGDSPTSPTSREFNQTVTGTVSAFGTTYHPLSTPRSGNMTLRLSWPGGADLDLFLSSQGCASLYPKSSCGILAGADGLVNPETITRTVAEGEAFRIWVDNLSLTQSVNYTLTIEIR